MQATAYRYDLNNRLTEVVTDPSGLNLRQGYRYDSLGNRIAEISANGHVTRTWFDAAGRALLTVDPNGLARSAQYDAVGNVLRTLQHAQPISDEDLARLDVLAVIALYSGDAEDRSVEHVYDKADREVLTRTEAARQYVNGAWVDGHRAETHMLYDRVGNLVGQIDGNGHTTYRYYDANRRLQGSLDAEGYLTVYTRDAFGNAVDERLYLERPELSASQKAELDLDGYAPAGAARVTTREYDALDHELRTLYPEAALFEGGVHSTAKVQVLRSFDAFGNVLSESVMHREGAGADPAPAATHYQYDAAGRLVTKVDARADELIASDAAHIIALRKDLGVVNAAGAGKSAAELTEQDRAALLARHTCHYAYDAVGNVREQIEGERVTTNEYDRANRNVRVHYPATQRVEVDAAGNLSITENYRAVGQRVFDNAGNVLTEVKPDGERIHYEYDAANRQVKARNDGVTVDYRYNFAGELTSVRRSADSGWPSEEIQFEYDRLGRKLLERQVGLAEATGDDRIVRYGYDANGNQVQTTDARGNVATVVYDGLNRMVATVNREGGLTQTVYDAQGNVVARQTGGFTAPQLRGGVRHDRVSDQGAVIEWSTDHATDAVVYVRPAGSGAAWVAFGAAGSYRLDHSISLAGLSPDTEYEYYFVSKDAFGYTLQSAVRSVRTAAGIDAIAIDAGPPGGRALASPAALHAARRSRRRADPGQHRRGGFGRAGRSPLRHARAAARRQLHRERRVLQRRRAVPDRVDRRRRHAPHRRGGLPAARRDAPPCDASIEATPQGDNYALSVGWNLADVLAAGGIASDTVPGEPPTYSVYIGYSLNAGPAAALCRGQTRGRHLQGPVRRPARGSAHAAPAIRAARRQPGLRHAAGNRQPRGARAPLPEPRARIPRHGSCRHATAPAFAQGRPGRLERAARQRHRGPVGQPARPGHRRVRV